MSLGEDFAADAMAEFSGQLYDATLTQLDDGEIDPDDPTAAPDGDSTDYDCEGIAFTYEQRYIDGTRIVKGDYRVVLLRGSLDVMPAPGDTISIPPPGSSTPATARVINVEAVTEAAITLQVRG